MPDHKILHRNSKVATLFPYLRSAGVQQALTRVQAICNVNLEWRLRGDARQRPCLRWTPLTKGGSCQVPSRWAPDPVNVKETRNMRCRLRQIPVDDAGSSRSSKPPQKPGTKPSTRAGLSTASTAPSELSSNADKIACISRAASDCVRSHHHHRSYLCAHRWGARAQAGALKCWQRCPA